MRARALIAVLLLIAVGACQSDGDDSQTTTTAAPVDEGSISLTNLPIGDGRVRTEGPLAGFVFSCTSNFGTAGAHATGEWIDGDAGTFDFTAKPTVDGEETWPHELEVSIDDDIRIVTGNALPNHPTGRYPIAAGDDAYEFDRNPGRIAAKQLQTELTTDPRETTATCLPLGPIGVLLSGSPLFNALDGGGDDALAHEIQDTCGGHPQQAGVYHYHALTPCLEAAGDAGHSALVGYAADGFGIYGPNGEAGTPLTNDDLDECHGHRHAVDWDGVTEPRFHYHATAEYPYTLGCYRGTPVAMSIR